MPDEPIIHLEVRAATLAELKSYTDEIQADLGCRATAVRRDGDYVVDAYLPEGKIDAARNVRAAQNVAIRVVENATEVGRQRQQEVGDGNRFAARGEIPRGLGRKE
ncbi:hypothetical protein ACPW96_23170 [Micromonospora sp. DT81.3]|uniref:hypothetical protein n=1 Tax=Micromonospora sp. DT81.3 TaxID=3416523 RepID=UPI003CE9ECA5